MRQIEVSVLCTLNTNDHLLYDKVTKMSPLCLSCSESTLNPSLKALNIHQSSSSACKVEVRAVWCSEHSRVETMIWGDSLQGWRAAAPRGSDTTPRTAISSVRSVSEMKCALKSFTIPWFSGCISDFFNNLKMRGFVKMELMEPLTFFELQWLVNVWKGECWEGLKYEYFIVYVWQAIGYHLTREKTINTPLFILEKSINHGHFLNWVGL